MCSSDERAISELHFSRLSYKGRVTPLFSYGVVLDYYPTSQSDINPFLEYGRDVSPFELIGRLAPLAMPLVSGFIRERFGCVRLPSPFLAILTMHSLIALATLAADAPS